MTLLRGRLSELLAALVRGRELAWLLTLVFSSVLAVLAGFVLVTPERAQVLLMRSGYWVMLGVFVLFVLCLTVQLRRVLARGPVRWWLLLAALLGTLVVWLGDRPGYKVLYDEPTLQATAFRLQESCQLGTTVTGVLQGGQFVSREVMLDKRPYFYAFLLALVHQIFGYNESHAYALNAALLYAFLLCSLVLAVRLAGGWTGLFTLGFLCTLPVLSQSANGAGMEVHNLAMLALCAWAALEYLEELSAGSLALLCLGGVLLAQSRYESALYVVSVAGVVLAGWLRQGRPVWSWVLPLSPLLLVPCAWHMRFVASKPELWELKAGQSERFSLAYLSGNLEGAFRYFSSVGTELPNSPQLTLAGVAALGALGWVGVRRLLRDERSGPSWALWVPVLFGAGVFVNFGVLQLYYWARLDDFLACRFSLPLYWLLALCVPMALAVCARGRRVWILATLGVLLLGTVLHTVPCWLSRGYTVKNLVSRELEYERAAVAALPGGPWLVVTNKSTLVWSAGCVPSLMLSQEPEFWAWVGREQARGALRGVVVTQQLKPIGPGGELCIVPTDTLPDTVELIPAYEGRTETRVTRLSIVKGVRPDQGRQVAP